jgi:hypothetical protein
MPAAFAFHIVEEYRGGFPAWVTHVLGGSFNNVAFAYNNADFLVIAMTDRYSHLAPSHASHAIEELAAYAPV